MASKPESGELSSCGLCSTLSDHVREVKVTYHLCSDCKLQDYEVVKKGVPRPVPIVAEDPLAVGGQADATPKVPYTPPPRQVPPGISQQFKPDGYFPQ